MEPGSDEHEQRATEPDAGSVAESARRIITHLELGIGSAARLRSLCDEFENGWSVAHPAPSGTVLSDLARAAGTAVPSRAEPLIELLERLLVTSADPSPALAELLETHHLATMRRAIVLAGRLVAAGAMGVEPRLLARITAGAEAEPDLIIGEDLVEAVGGLLAAGAGGGDPAREVLLGNGPVAERRLAAVLLDARGTLPTESTASTLLGERDWRTLAPYLMFTRARHRDLLDISLPTAGGPPLASAVATAEGACGEEVLRALIAELGWGRVSLGLEVQRLIGISISGSLPLWMRPDEATWVSAAVAHPCRRREVCLAIAHGGSSVEEHEGDTARPPEPIERFRNLNLLHAQLLQDFLDVAPLTVEVAGRITERMDTAVAEFAALFAEHAAEGALVADVFHGLRHRIAEALAAETGPVVRSAEVARLVKAFEDPATVAEVTTLHGLKRYLHQRGLQLAPRLGGRRTERLRSVDVAVAEGRDVTVARRIRYVDLEGGDMSDAGVPTMPGAVRMLAEAFAAHLRAGHSQLPHTDVYCYGNEIHVYLSFRNHPAFIRLDLSPPLQGGMVDLEYFGVSAYEHGHHPSPDLPAVTAFLREVGYAVAVDGTRIHARCDKESVLDLATLCERAAALFRLAPVLMDLDWAVGSLDLDSTARGTLIRSWAGKFRDWGVLPLAELTTADHRGVLIGVDTGPTGHREMSWTGAGPVRDRFDPAPPVRLLGALRSGLCDLGLGPTSHEDEAADHLPGQLELEAAVLWPLREAVDRGELELVSGGFRRVPGDRFVAEHEAVVFARRVALGVDAAARMIRAARLVTPLERTLVFQTTGRVAGREVQRARLGLVRGALTLFVLRDEHGLIRLALYARETGLFRRRATVADRWTSNARDDARALAVLLRRNNYQVAGAVGDDGSAEAEAARLIDDLHQRQLTREPGPLPGENLVPGIAASPGRVAGRAVFDFADRPPQQLNDAVLVSSTIGPDDTIALYHAGGVVSTGGGALSHAGLIAIQFHKPAMVVRGSWLSGNGGGRVMVLPVPEYREEETTVGHLDVVVRRDARERSCHVRQGDLLLVNATLGTLRVLGQEATTIALFDELRSLGNASRSLDRAVDEREVLALRGRRVRCRHRLEQILRRLADPVIARWVVREMLLGDLLSSGPGGQADRRGVIEALLGNTEVGSIARTFVQKTVEELTARLRSGLDDARSTMAGASSLMEILHPRLEVLRLADVLAGATSCLSDEAGIPRDARQEVEGLDTLAASSLRRLRDHLGGTVERLSPRDPGFRHLVRQLECIDTALSAPSGPGLPREYGRQRLAAIDESSLERVAAELIARPIDGGLELTPLVGAKAANLGEVGRILGQRLVPPWFAITDAAFRATLALRPSPRALESSGLAAATASLAEGIADILGNSGPGAAEQSRRIRNLWNEAELPQPVVREVLEAYRELAVTAAADSADIDADGPFVALRSSAREEDVEQATRAGEFDTFLFIKGERSLLECLKLTWSGLWTERAIHNRAAMRSTGQEGGGVIVQRVVWSRASGVALTINVGAGRLREIVINAGLGLGEGVVSGSVAADLITVDKESVASEEGLRFSYITADKRQRIVFNRAAGAGTVIAETLYHQRLRPALEYAELCELVAAIVRLEAAYGYPLDVEFAWENHRLWILQARPVATFFADLRDTVERFPLAASPTFVNAADDSEVSR